MKQQKEILMKMIINCSHNKIYKGLDFSKKTSYKFSEIPGVTESGWTESEYNNTIEDEKTFDEHCRFVVETLVNHKSSWPFREPVSIEEVADYYDVIKDPIDLQTMTTRISEGYYTTVDLFIDDVIRMFTNCRKYNDKDTIYWLLANMLEDFVKPFLTKMKHKFGSMDVENPEK